MSNMVFKILRKSNTKPAEGGLLAHRFILAEFGQDYVTWRQNTETKDTEVYWGHYFPKWTENALENANADFENRLLDYGFKEIK